MVHMGVCLSCLSSNARTAPTTYSELSFATSVRSGGSLGPKDVQNRTESEMEFLCDSTDTPLVGCTHLPARPISWEGHGFSAAAVAC